MKKPKIRITLVDRVGPCKCHRGHQIGDSFDFDTQRGALVPWPCMWRFPLWISCGMVGRFRRGDMEIIVFCCPDADVMNVFRLDVVRGEDIEEK